MTFGLVCGTPPDIRGGGRGHQISERKTRTDERHEQTGMSRT